MRTRFLLPAVVIVCALFLPAVATAQERIELFTFTGNDVIRAVEVDATVSGFGRVTAITGLPSAFIDMSDATAVAGGRYVAWTTPTGLFVLDRRTRSMIDATRLLPVRTWLRIVAADSHQPRLFIRDGLGPDQTLWTIDLRGGPPVRLGATSWIVGAAYAAERDEVYYTSTAFEPGGQRTSSIIVTNATTGLEQRRWQVSGAADAVAVDPAGRLLWVDHGGLEARDALTGQVLARSDQFSAATAMPDPQRGLLFLRQGDFLVAVDPLRLTEIGRARVSFTPPDEVVRRRDQTLPGRWMTGAYTLRFESRVALIRSGRVFGEDIVEKTCQLLDLDALEATGARRATADVLGVIGGGSQVGERGGVRDCRALGVVVRSPFPPTSLAASVSGNGVSLTWKDPGDTTDFEIEFGFAPGQRAGSMKVGHLTSIGIPGVPPGVYYVRVKGANEVGPSPASNEVRVVVQ